MRNKRSNLLSWTLCSLLVATFGQNARADLIVELNSAGIAVGSSAAIDVFTRSSDANAVVIGFYELEFLITPFGATAGTTLQFADPQAETHLASGSYLFSGLSAGGPTTAVSGTANNTLAASDFVTPDGNVSLTTQKLLARLDLSHYMPVGVDSSSVVGDTFRIELTDATFEAYNGSGYELVPGGFTSNASSITVAVPEPTSLLWAAIAVPLALLRRSRSTYT